MALGTVTKHPFLDSGEGVARDSIFRQFGGVRVGGVTVPMPPSRVGGDSIGAVAVGDGFISFVVDGQGKGIPASHLGAMMRHGVLSAIRSGTNSTAHY